MISVVSPSISDSERNTINIENTNKHNWTDTQDTLLLTLVNRFDRKWKKVSEIIKTKSPNQCAYRYCKLKGKYERKYFSERDKDLLINCIQTYGENWEQIAIVMKKFSKKVLQKKYEKMKKDDLIIDYGNNIIGESTQNESFQSITLDKEDVVKDRLDVKFNKRKIVNLFFYLTAIFKIVNNILNKHPNTSSNKFIKQQIHLLMDLLNQFQVISKQYKFSFHYILNELIIKLAQCYNQMAKLIHLSKLYCIRVEINSFTN